ncbi:MAG TPA: DUF4258 domain-containing protein [Gemmataceae bacterium]|jgi:hypothetical protein|nr:DUF4258 domain-containing protein [Gemmataceae bacterium]
MPPKPIRISAHARFEMKRRRIKQADVMATIRHPGQVVPSIKGRQIYQSKIGRAGRSLLRVVVKEDAHAYQVVTAYKTTKVTKYWRVP